MWGRALRSIFGLLLFEDLKSYSTRMVLGESVLPMDEI
jgi:hypothetical protein